MTIGIRLIPVVMCGGAGTRLWPVSRDSMPKQFITLLGQESTFQRTMRLLSDRAVFEPALVVTNDEYRFTVQDQLAAVGVEAQIVLEPTRRDSAPAAEVTKDAEPERQAEAAAPEAATDVADDGPAY